MGGNAHPSYSPARLTSSQRLLVISRLTSHFSTNPYFTHFLSPAPAPGKITHGDVDFVAVLAPEFEERRLQHILAEAGLFDKTHDHSYLYRLPSTSTSSEEDLLVQVDIETILAAKLPLNLLMKSYGDLGAILGAYARHLGFKLGPHNGLQYRSKLPLSGTEVAYDFLDEDERYDPKVICERFLGLEYARWQRGFESEEDVFEWTRPAVWYLAREARNPKRERPMFARFAAWCLEQTSAGPAEVDGKGVLEREGLWHLVGKQYDEDMKRERFQHDVKAVFNGRVAMEYLQKRHGVKIEGLELGRFMAKVKGRLREGEVPTRAEVERAIDEEVLSKRFAEFAVGGKG